MMKSGLHFRNNFYFWLLITLMIGVGCLRIGSTYSVFWQTWDEPFHIAAGMEWLDKGQYTYELFHPPLARVMSALGPYLNGIRVMTEVSEPSQAWEEGNAILHAMGTYEHNLTLARIGILPFFMIASLVVALWAKNCGGQATSLLATLLFTTLPPILAHAGLATLDMACAALVAAALFAWTLWLTKPTLLRSFCLGIAVGLAILSKLSALGFLVIGGTLTTLIFGIPYFRKEQLKELRFFTFKQRFVASVIALLLCALTIWAGYRFSTSPIISSEHRPHEKIDDIIGSEGLAHDFTYFILENSPVPAPEFVGGIEDFLNRNDQGHLAYLMGDISKDGWWYFFPTLFLFKTPLPFVGLIVIGIFFAFRNISQRDVECLLILVPAAAATGILAISMLGSVNNGVRQILSLYPLLAIVAGYGANELITLNQKKRLVRIGLLAVLFSWQLVSSFASHPDYLAYFNELANSHPEEIVVDSDLDWGQDLRRLSLTLKDRGIDELKLEYNGSQGMDLTQFNLPENQDLTPYQRETGWIAISIHNLTLGTRTSPYDQYSWLREYQPIEQVGKSIWLYYIPEN